MVPRPHEETICRLCGWWRSSKGSQIEVSADQLREDAPYATASVRVVRGSRSKYVGSSVLWVDTGGIARWDYRYSVMDDHSEWPAKICWWANSTESSFFWFGDDRPSPKLASLCGASVSQGFGGRKLHAVQIGLGTFATFVQNFAGRRSDWDLSVDWLVQSTSERTSEQFRAVAVEPVREHIERLRPLLVALPNVQLVQKAIGERDAEGNDIFVLTQQACKALLQAVPKRRRRKLAGDLSYLRNMSCVGEVHPLLERCREHAWNQYGVDIQMEPQRTDVWSYARLAASCDFCGCEVLLVDAEGHDAEILRSVIRHCRERGEQGQCAWPDLIVFESMGHCDQKEGPGAESAIVEELRRCGYQTLQSGCSNTEMIHGAALDREPRLQEWVQQWRCDGCQGAGPWPFTWLDRKLLCSRCGATDEN